MNKEKKAVSRHSLSFRARIKKRVVFDSATQLGIDLINLKVLDLNNHSGMLLTIIYCKYNYILVHSSGFLLSFYNTIYRDYKQNQQ